MDNESEHQEELTEHLLQADQSLIKPVDGSTPDDWIARYEVLEKLGQGSLTSVYKVRRQGIDQVFAAKVLLPQFAENPRTAKRFMQEAQKASSLNHAHLVSVYDTGKTTSGEPFVICDFVQGGSLAERLAQTKRLAQVAVLDLFLQVCEGLNHAHKSGVIHRDIKPANIVFKQDEAVELVKLADFGIAKVLPSAGRETKYFTPEGDAFGNPTYMSPEQIQGSRLDGRADIYALGCVMYECLCGAPPFTGVNCVTVALQQVQLEPPPLRLRAPDVRLSPSIEIVVMRMLAKNPDDRYQTIAEVLAELKIVRSGGQVKPPPAKVVVIYATPGAASGKDSEGQSAEGHTDPVGTPKQTAPLPARKVKTAEQKIGQALAESSSPKSSLRFDGKLAGNAMEHSEGGRFVLKTAAGAAGKGNDRHDQLSIIEAEKAGKRNAVVDRFIEVVQERLSQDKGVIGKSYRNMIRQPAPSLTKVVVLASLMGIVLSFFSINYVVENSTGRSLFSFFSSAGSHRRALMVDSSAQFYGFDDEVELYGANGRRMPADASIDTLGGRPLYYYNKDHFAEAMLQLVATNQDLSGANLRGQNLSGLLLAGARLHGADLSYCRMDSANFYRADLSEANLSYANLLYADLSKANLRNATLKKTNLIGAEMRQCDTSGADLSDLSSR